MDFMQRDYPLKPDMMFGWKPDIQSLGAPIPLTYDDSQDEILKQPGSYREYPVCYYGPRYANSIVMHQAYANRAQATSDP
jgi:hypothetical protein